MQALIAENELLRKQTGGGNSTQAMDFRQWKEQKKLQQKIEILRFCLKLTVHVSQV